MALLDELVDKEPVAGDDFKKSRSFFSCGYMFRVSLAVVSSHLNVGISFQEPALGFVKVLDKARGGQAAVDTDEIVKVFADCRVNGGPKKEVCVNLKGGLVGCASMVYNDLPGAGILAPGTVLSQLLTEKGLVWDGHLHLIVKQNSITGPLKRGT